MTNRTSGEINMAEITAALIRELRESSGAGMMDCKKALVEAEGNMEAAIDWLRKKGLAAAAKKSGRIAAEGLVGVATGPQIAAADAQVTAMVLQQLGQGVSMLVGARVMSTDAARVLVRKAGTDFVGTPYPSELDNFDAVAASALTEQVGNAAAPQLAAVPTPQEMPA
jgi:hypothetical protein